MQSVQRSIVKLRNKAPGDNSKVSVLLSDYEDADKVLAKLIDHTRSWRESWVSLTKTQLGIVTEYDGLYDPIEGSARANGTASEPTPELQLNRTFKLKQAYSDLQSELMDEVAQIETTIVKPLQDTRDYISPMRKTMKKRENKRLDYEKAQDKVVKLQRKHGNTPKEEAVLAKAEDEVSRAANNFQVADAHLRETLAPLVHATFNIIPPIVATIVLVQNRLLGLYYTTLHKYCEDHDFPSPPPPMDEVVACWSADFSPAKRAAERLDCVAHGKAAKRPMHIMEEPSPAIEDGRKSSMSSLSSFRRTSSGLIPGRGAEDRDSPGPMPPRPTNPRMASDTSMRTPLANSGINKANHAMNSKLGVPTEFTKASGIGKSPSSSPGSFGPRSDCFPRPGTSSTMASTVSLSSVASIAAMAAKKKPPPPPPKRIVSTKPDEYVIAQYAFSGQGQGDLSFQEGDRIRVVKKSGTDQDWWVGELGGVQGSFPANYCRAA